MPQSLARNLIHLIFSTKNRKPVILKPTRPELHKYMAGILAEWDSSAINIGAVADHVHLLFCLSKNHALSKIVEQVKKGSSKWIKTQGVRYSTFQWQRYSQGDALGWIVTAFQANVFSCHSVFVWFASFAVPSVISFGRSQRPELHDSLPANRLLTNPRPRRIVF